jgi:hypothetical protein
MFRDDEQAALACRALLAFVSLEDMWTTAGPTPEALALIHRDGGPLSSGERVMLLTAWAFWRGGGSDVTVRLVELLEVLGLEQVHAIATLMIARARGSKFVDEWLALYGVPTTA